MTQYSDHNDGQRQSVVSPNQTTDPSLATARPGGEGSLIEVHDLWVRYGDKLAVKNVSFAIAAHEHVSLLGPSGCGKTTTLRCLAGLVRPLSGVIRIDGRDVFSSKSGAYVPVQKRNLSMMFQSYAIWPHMTVAENIGYPLRLRKVPKKARRERVAELLTMIDMDGYGGTPASSLSGGQQQRVALARSYADPPHALLLDEPLSNLDARLRDQMRSDLARFQREFGITTVYVTHDQEEAMSLSSRIIVMANGEAVQVGSPREVYDTPADEFVADFIGAANVIEGELAFREGQPLVTLADGARLLGERRTHTWGPAGPVRVAIRVVYPRLSTERPEGGDNVFRGVVTDAAFLGDSVRYVVESAICPELRVKALPTSSYRIGDELWIDIPPMSVIPLECRS